MRKKRVTRDYVIHTPCKPRSNRLPANRLYWRGNYSQVKAQALRLGYPFKLTLREFQTIKPIECNYGHMAWSDGYLLMLDTLVPAKGFIVGNTIFVCTRHLGGMNTTLPCSNVRQLEPRRSLREKIRFKTLVKRKGYSQPDINA